RAVRVFALFQSLSPASIWNDQAIVEALVISFKMLMEDEFRDRAPQRILAEPNHPIQAQFLNRSNEAFRRGVQIPGPARQSDRLNPDIAKHVEKLIRINGSTLITMIGLRSIDLSHALEHR